MLGAAELILCPLGLEPSDFCQCCVPVGHAVAFHVAAWVLEDVAATPHGLANAGKHVNELRHTAELQPLAARHGRLQPGDEGCGPVFLGRPPGIPERLRIVPAEVPLQCPLGRMGGILDRVLPGDVLVAERGLGQLLELRRGRLGGVPPSGRGVQVTRPIQTASACLNFGDGWLDRRRISDAGGASESASYVASDRGRASAAASSSGWQKR